MKYYEVKLSDSGSIAVDDTILVKEVPAAAGSRIMEGFVPPFGAEVVDRLEASGYEISGKTCVGEFGLDLVGEFSHSKAQEGTLAGAAASLVKEGNVKAALAVDMNGAPRRAAALAGITFLKPTYGTVSRYGVISCAASGEQIGVYGKKSADVAEIMGVIAGHDDKDGTSLPELKYEYTPSLEVSGKRVAVICNLAEKSDETVQQNIKAMSDSLKAKGVKVEEINCDLFETANVAWQILMSAETCNNISRYDGVKFGYRSENYKNIDELYINTRTEGFNFLTKAVILYGSDVLSKNRYSDCYDKSLRVRRIAKDGLKKLFEQYDALLLPAMGKAAYESYDISEAFTRVYEESVYTAAANLTGIPALVSGGVQLMGKVFSEQLLLSLAACTEKEGE